MSLRPIGRLLRGVHAGEATLTWNRPAVQSAPDSIVLTSPAFVDGGAMPVRYAATGENLSPPLTWSNIPADTVELVLLMEDPDAPVPVPPPHVLVTGLPPGDGGVAEGGLNRSAGLCFGRWIGLTLAYRGPRPPPGHGPHRYVFQVFALNRALSAGKSVNRKILMREMNGRLCARGRLTGTFERL